ncbi:MAG: Gfo/Idh/MocA family oxidoreductase [Firmicutes bacterium]|nr:Gfo/Idh/MocA family oxidoreductase [Bacillota bacterium]
MNSKKVRFAIIGSGMISNFHARAIEEIEKAELVAVYDNVPEKAMDFAEKKGITVYSDLDEMLKSGDIDAVSICTPSGLHTPQALKCIEHGKHVVCEKPMSLTLEEADQLIEAAEKAGILVCVISQFRFSPAVQEIRKAIDAGAFGNIVSGSLSMKYYRSDAYYASAGWRGTWNMDGGGALMNQGIHGIDMYRYLMGPVASLTAIACTQTRNIEVEDSAVAILQFENGAVGTIEGSTTCYPGYPRRLEICGDKGSVVLEEDSIMRWDLEIPCGLPVGKQAENVASSDPGAINVSGHVYQIQNFVNGVLYGEPLLNDAKNGRLPLEIILGIYESSKEGKTVYPGK